MLEEYIERYPALRVVIFTFCVVANNVEMQRGGMPGVNARRGVTGHMP